MAGQWTREQLFDLMTAYQPACVLAAAAELDVFTALADGTRTAEELANLLSTDLRGMTVLLDALAGLTLLTKEREQYACPAGLADLLAENRPGNISPMIRHWSNCLRRWGQLAEVVKTGQPACREPSIRGEEGDREAFIQGMNVLAEPGARELLAELMPLSFTHLLDLGGGSGSWTAAFLRAVPQAKATIFDLPEVLPMARERMAALGMAERVNLVPGDFYTDDLPSGADLVWLSAICHQNSRAQNRTLFARIREHLARGGTLLIRDVVMADDHTQPPAGALFAINMLVATEQGGTYSMAEYRADLQAAGFTDVQWAYRHAYMNNVISAKNG